MSKRNLWCDLCPFCHVLSTHFDQQDLASVLCRYGFVGYPVRGNHKVIMGTRLGTGIINSKSLSSKCAILR